MKQAYLAGGCFWCVEAAYNMLKGVEKVTSGYCNGHTKNPSYEDVCSGTTGHAEAVKIDYDPDQISYSDIIHIFFTAHDPTTLNRQGNDTGTQYRSAIFYTTDEEKQIAKQTIQELTDQKIFSDPIVTEVTPLDTFYPAENYHQEYYQNNPLQPYCMAVISPKIAKFRTKWRDRLKG